PIYAFEGVRVAGKEPLEVASKSFLMCHFPFVNFHFYRSQAFAGNALSEWLVINDKWKMSRLFMQFTHTTLVARRWHTEQCVTMRGEPAIEDGSQLCQRPN